MERFEDNGVNYWILLEDAVNSIDSWPGYIAYFNDKEPTEICLGRSVKDDQDRTVFFSSKQLAIQATQEAIIANKYK